MQSWRRLVYFLLLNVLVSAVTVWVVVSIMMRNNTIPAVVYEEPTLAVSSGSQSGEAVATRAPAADSPSDATAVISDILEIKSVIGIGELETERVQIEHVGDVEVSLDGWQLQDEDGHVYTFPALTMFSGGRVTVYTREGTSSVVELYWGLDEAIWQVGEKALLLDPQGNVQAVYEIP